MTEAVSEGRALTVVQRYIADVLPPGKSEDVYSSLPAHVSPARFERNLANALMREPKLLQIDPRKVYREVCKIAALGLVLDPQLGEAYLIADRNGDVQARIGYRGLIKLARQSGNVEALYAHDICQNDVTRVTLGTDKRLEHAPDFLKPRGPVGAYYAVVRFSDVSSDFEVMTLEEVHAIRDRSDAWKAFKRGLIKSTPWGTDEGEMAKKTVLRRLLKRCPMSPDLADVLAREDEADMRDAIPPEPSRVASLTQRLQGSTGSGFAAGYAEAEAAAALGYDEDGVIAEGEEAAGAETDAAPGNPAPEAETPASGAPSATAAPSATDEPAEGDLATDAYKAGKAARKRGVKASAVPAAWGTEEGEDWTAGWVDQDEAMKAGRE
jgi:recombination protein RecT